MRSRAPFVAAALLLAGLALAVDTGAGDADLEKGIRQAQEGEFEQAIATLRAALPRLKDGSPQDLTRAHVYLGVAQLGLGDAAAARSSFLEALRADRSLRLSAEEYPPRVLRAFDEARSALPPEPVPAATQPAPTVAPAPVARPEAGAAAPPGGPAQRARRHACRPAGLDGVRFGGPGAGAEEEVLPAPRPRGRGRGGGRRRGARGGRRRRR